MAKANAKKRAEENTAKIALLFRIVNPNPNPQTLNPKPDPKLRSLNAKPENSKP